MTLKDRYDAAKGVRREIPPTPGQEFINELMAVTRKSEAAVRRWLGGQCLPDALTRQVLASHFGCDAGELFPAAEAPAEESSMSPQ